jgi:proteasome lid subunit RPN8/RPN11
MTTELTEGAMAKRRLPELLHSLSAWVGPSRAEAGSELPPEDQTEGSLHLVERPVDRSVLWLPGGWGEQRIGRPYPYELFVASEVLGDVEDHALEEIEGSYGLLTGRLLACKETRVPFVSVEASHRSDSPMPVGEDLASFREFFWKVGEVAARRGRILVGWYHTHSLLGLQLSERDRQVHVAHFRDEWPCALVVVTRHGASEGGFFQRDRGDILFRRSTRPFRELMSQRVEPGGGPYVTSLAWSNYWTHEPVLYARKPGDLPSKGGKWSWGQRPRFGARSGKTLTDLAARISEESADDDSGADLSGADLQRPTAAETGTDERRESAEPTYERAMGRPVREDGVAGSARPIPAGPPPKEAWDEWKKALGVRREREDEIRKVEAEQEAVDAARADAEAEARAKAALAARTAAEAAARAAADALGIGSEGEAIAAEAMSRAEADAEALVAEEEAARLAAKEEMWKKAAPVAKKGKAKAEEPEVEESVDVPVGAPESDEQKVVAESDEEEAAAESDEEAAAGVVESESPSEAELADVEVPDVEVPDVEVPEVAEPEPAVETGGEPEPWAKVEEETFALKVAAHESEPDRAEARAASREEAPAGEIPKELARRAEVVARSSFRPAADGQMVVPPLVLPDPLPRARLRRYAAWLGIGLPLAAALAWVFLG